MRAALPTPDGGVYIDDQWGSKDVDSVIKVTVNQSADSGPDLRYEFEYDDSAQRLDQISNARAAAAKLAVAHGLTVVDRTDHALPCSCPANAGRPAVRRLRV